MKTVKTGGNGKKGKVVHLTRIFEGFYHQNAGTGTYASDEVGDQRRPEEEGVLHYRPLVGQERADLVAASQRSRHVLKGRYRVGDLRKLYRPQDRRRLVFLQNSKSMQQEKKVG